MKILVIEDQDALREEIVEILSLEKFQVFDAENGQIGIKMATANLPDLILCDVMMPELDGYGVLTALRQDPSTATIPFVFLTARVDKADLRQGMKLGADDYLTKPFTRVELLDAIATQARKQEAIERKTKSQIENLRSNITLSLPHELHTPLAAIIGMSELLIEDYGLVEAADGLEMLETIHTSAERLYRLTQNFLLYAELELLAADSERVTLSQESRVSSEVIAIITEVALQTADKVNRRNDLRINVQDVTVLMSGLRLKKIVEELIDNAFKFSEPGTIVHIRGILQGDGFHLSVTDHGRGMTDSQIANIGAYMQFERRIYEQQGSGLGLVIAKRLTELHGGKFAIESIPEERTTIAVTLRV